MIELKHIQVNAGSFSLQNISMQLEHGQFHVLLGPSGSGKTVLIETIAGLIQAASGHIFFDKKNIGNLPPEKRNLSYLPQDNTLFPHKNVYENIAFGLQFKLGRNPATINEKIHHIASELDISHLLERRIGKLSGGEQQRVSLARALVLENPFLLLDEPTSSLQETMQESFCLMLKEIQSHFQLTVLMTTHHKDSAFLLADKLHFIEDGKLLLSIPTQELPHISLPAKVAEILGIQNILKFKRLPDREWNYYAEQTDSYFVLKKMPGNLPEEFLIGVKPADIRVIKKEEMHLSHPNSFPAVVENTYPKENNTLVVLKIPKTGCVLKMEISNYNLKKMGIEKGGTIHCKIKEEHARVLC